MRQAKPPPSAGGGRAVALVQPTRRSASSGRQFALVWRRHLREQMSAFSHHGSAGGKKPASIVIFVCYVTQTTDAARAVQPH